MKLLIIGHPRCGKSTLGRAKRAALPPQGGHELRAVIHTDDLIKQYEWSAFSDKVCDLLKQPGPWIIEGCSAVRGLRKYLREGNKVDFEIVWLDTPYIPLVGKQIGFAASLTSIWGECQQMIKENKHDN